MSAAATRRALLAALLLLALGGLILHLRIHPYLKADPADPAVTLARPWMLPATILPLVDVLLVTALFAFRRTAPLGHLLNGMLVIYGTVLMLDYSFATLGGQGLGPFGWALRSTLPHVSISWGDFFIGKALFDAWMLEAT